MINYSDGIMVDSIEYAFSVIKSNLDLSFTLECGPAEGVMTKKIKSFSNKLEVIEGSNEHAKILKVNYPKVKVYNKMFEDFETSEKYTSIIMSHVLEHVEDPVFILKKFSKYLTKNGKIFALVPNANSIHRQAAVIMGLLKSNDQLNDRDITHGHKRVFSPSSLKNIFNKSNLNIDLYGGYWLKPFSNGQIEKYFDKKMLEAFLKLGESFPDIAAEIYIIASLKNEK